MPRTPVTDRIMAVLHSGRTWMLYSYEMPGPTLVELTQAVYEVEKPTDAQRAAVRRAVRKLVAEGHVDSFRPIDGYGGTGYHTRERNGWVWTYRNPGGVRVCLPEPSPEDSRA